MLGIGSTMTGKDGMTLLYVPAGEFTMGSESDKHLVYLDAFWIDQTEVTYGMYQHCIEEGICEYETHSIFSAYGYDEPSNFDNYPVSYLIDWYEAKTYCEWVDRRLPTDAEWEKAARGTDERVYPWGNTFDGIIVNYCDVNCPKFGVNAEFNDGYVYTSPVGSYPAGASPYGALDMVGNVWEWVSDGYSETQAPIEVLRGGSYRDNDKYLDILRKQTYMADTSSEDIGFRCAMDASPEALETSQFETPTPKSSSSNPQDDPLTDWKSIPIMPGAIKGYQSDDGDSYSYTIDIQMQEVVDYYDEQLLDLGWKAVSALPLGGDGYILMYEDRDGTRLSILVSNQEDELLLVRMGYPFEWDLQ